MKKMVIIILVFLITPVLCHAINNDGGGAAAFLKLSSGAVPASLGKAYIAKAEGSEAVVWNPAGLAEIEKNDLTLMLSRPFNSVKDIDFHLINFGYRVRENLAVGVNISYLQVSNIEGYDLVGTASNSYDDKEIAFMMSLGYKKNENLYLGATVKIITQNIADNRDIAYSSDLGVKYKYNDQIKFGFMLQDILSTDLNLIEVNDFNGTIDSVSEIPVNIRFGMLYTPIEFLDINAQIDKMEGRDVIGRIGVEGRLLKYFRLRAGYSTEIDEFGAGLGFWISNYRVDYSITRHQYLGYSNRVTLGMKF